MFVEVGRIGRPFGVRGWVHVESWCESPEQLLSYVPWQVVSAGGARLTRTVAEARSHGDGLVVRLDGVDSRDAAAALTGAVLEVERERLPAPAQGAYYQVDLIGCRVVNEDGVLLGVVDHFVDAPAGAVMVVRGEREHWLPSVKPHLRSVDLAARELRVDWPADF
ncbi:MAG: ribosome maturation factor RimM [Steroidobacteraceae bacterium]